MREPSQCVPATRQALDQNEGVPGVLEAEVVLDQEPADPSRRRPVEASIAIACHEDYELQRVVQADLWQLRRGGKRLGELLTLQRAMKSPVRRGAR